MSTLALAPRSSPLTNLRLHAVGSLILVVSIFGGFTYWASVADIAGAVAASGVIVVDSFAKRIQHQEGGTVKAFYVRDGDVVEAGQLLVELDNTKTSADLAILDKRVHEALLREARQIAEINGAEDITIPAEIAPIIDEPEVRSMLQTERQVMAVREAGRASRASQLSEQVTQLERQIEGLTLQLTASEQQLDILNGEVVGVKQLYQGQLIEVSRITTLEKQIAQGTGEKGRLIASIAETRASIAERKLQIDQVDQDFVSNVLDDLQETRRVLYTAQQDQIAAADTLERTKLRSPQAGVIHQSTIHTVGGVVTPGETLMEVVPQSDDLLISARISPMDIDKVYVDQDVSIRLVGLSQRTTPELAGKVITLAPDLSQDQNTGQTYFTSRIQITDEELHTLPEGVKLTPGMPVETFIKTADRTILDYLIKPFVDQLSYAFRED